MTTYASYSLPIGAEATGSDGAGYQADNVTLGTLATDSTGIIELRVDVSTVTTMTRREIDLVLQAFRRRLLDSRYGPADFGMI